jgi:hypothetical protein
MVDDNFFTAFDNHSMSNRPFPSQIGVMERTRIYFLVRQLKTYLALLVQHGRAPFIHPLGKSPTHPTTTSKFHLGICTIPKQERAK